MDNSTITLKPVKELVGMSFYIPDYQRGYRWLKQQATDFLEDIWAFANDIHKSDDEIYCIQPLVVQRKTDKNLLENIRNADTIHKVESLLKGSWNVVDGQQRLTTIYLILSALGVNHLYSIEYQTRNGSRDYLENIDAERKLENIDFYHRYINEVGESVWDEELQMNIPTLIRVDSNEKLKEQIDRVVNQTRLNYENK